MAFDVTGKIVVIYDTVQKSGTFRTREFAIENSEENAGRVFTNYIKFQTTQDRTSILDKVKVGETVKVHFNIRGTKWAKDGKDSFFTNLDAWRIESVLPGGNGGGNQASNNDFDPTAVQTSEIPGDDLPF
eukprot:gene5997-8126_t